VTGFFVSPSTYFYVSILLENIGAHLCNLLGIAISVTDQNGTTGRSPSGQLPRTFLFLIKTLKTFNHKQSCPGLHFCLSTASQNHFKK
jgi:hypothetical protein